MVLRNFTGRLERGEAFVKAKAALADTGDLSVHIKFTRARGRDLNGYYRWDDRRMVLAVKQRLRYPRKAAYGVGTVSLNSERGVSSMAGRRGGYRGLPYRLVWHEEQFDSADDLLVFVAGHEFWHFLCHSGQRKRDHETKANCNGFAWLREFRAWAGPGAPVAGIPLVPPRPDRPEARTEVEVPEAPPLVAVPAAAAAQPTTPGAPTLFDLEEPSPRPARPRAATRIVAASLAALDAARQLVLFR